MTETGLTDARLISLYLKGEESSFEELYQRYRLQLYAYLNRTVAGQSQVVDDLFQQTWIKAIDNLGRYKDKQKFLSWLLRIAHNLAMDHFRRQQRFKSVEISDRIPVEDDGPPGYRLDQTSLAEALRKAMAELSDEQQEVLELRRQNVSFKDIAKLQQTNINTVLGRMHYAVKILQRRFADWR